jgi:hypothetical protein
MSPEPHSDWPIIVGGCHRSGTSLVRRILDSHSRIHCGPEVKFFADLYGDRVRDPWRMLRFLATALTLVDSDELLDVLGPAFVEIHRRAALAAGKPRWADKVPENVLYCRQWQRLLGDRWLLVHVLRNPLDTIASISDARYSDIPAGLPARIEYYRNHVDAGLRFGGEHPERYIPVIYEQLVAQPRETLAALMSALGETFEPPQLSFNAQPHQFGLEDAKIASTTEIHSASVDRWPSVLSAEEATIVWDQAGELWTRVDPDVRFVTVPAGR